MNEEKKTESNLSENVTVGTIGGEMLGRYSEAGKQFKVAYDGIDNATGQKLEGLKELFGQGENIERQQGFAAEILDTAKQNADNIKHGRKKRVIRTDDVVDPNTGKRRPRDQQHDQVTLDAKGKIIKGSGVQMKSYKDADAFVQHITADIKSDSSWANKYPDGKYRVPADHYDSIKRKLQEKIKALESRGDLSDEERKLLEYIKKVEKNLQKSTVTRKEATAARKNPKKVTAKEIMKTSHEAGVESAKVGAAVGGVISLIRNTCAVLKQEKDPKDAALDVAKDTAVTGTVGYGTAFVNTSLASVMKNSKDKLTRVLGNASAPAYIIQTASSTVKSMHRLCCGKITVDEFFLEIGKDGTGLLASVQGAVIGQAIIPIPIVGALVGSLVSTLICENIYDITVGMRMLNAEIDAFCNRLEIEIAALKDFRGYLESLNIDGFARETEKYARIVDFLSGNYSDQDFNSMLKLVYDSLDIKLPWQGDFNEFMGDRNNRLVFS